MEAKVKDVFKSVQSVILSLLPKASKGALHSGVGKLYGLFSTSILSTAVRAMQRKHFGFFSSWQ